MLPYTSACWKGGHATHVFSAGLPTRPEGQAVTVGGVGGHPPTAFGERPPLHTHDTAGTSPALKPPQFAGVHV